MVGGRGTIEHFSGARTGGLEDPMRNTPLKLTQELVDQLNALIRTNIDSTAGFLEAAEHVNDPELQSRFRNWAQERRSSADELRRFLEVSDQQPEASGSALGAIHRWWLEMRARLADGDPDVVLDEAERGEE